MFGGLVSTDADPVTRYLISKNTMGNGQNDNCANALQITFWLQCVLGIFGEF